MSKTSLEKIQNAVTGATTPVVGTFYYKQAY